MTAARISSSRALPGAVLQALATHRFLPIRVSHEVPGATPLTDDAGNLWHGLFGAALAKVSPTAFEVLFAGDAGSHPWRLVPPLTSGRTAGGRRHFDSVFVLMGPAVDHAGACLEAIDQMGTMGFGRDRVRASGTDIRGLVAHGEIDCSSLPGEIPEGYFLTLAHGLDAIEPLAGQPREPLSIQLNLITPLALKDRGKALRSPPDMASLVTRVLGRLTMLLPRDLPGGWMTAAEKQLILQHAKAIGTVANELEWKNWSRYSGRQRKSMPFGGLTGWIRYSGRAVDIEAVRPWLGLGTWIGIGSKTTFGLGHVEARLLPSHSEG